MNCREIMMPHVSLIYFIYCNSRRRPPWTCPRSSRPLPRQLRAVWFCPIWKALQRPGTSAWVSTGSSSPSLVGICTRSAKVYMSRILYTCLKIRSFTMRCSDVSRRASSIAVILNASVFYVNRTLDPRENPHVAAIMQRYKWKASNYKRMLHI